MTNLTNLLLVLAGTASLASASPLQPRQELVDLQNPFNLTILYDCGPKCKTDEVDLSWLVITQCDDKGNMNGTTLYDFKPDPNSPFPDLKVVAEIPFHSSEDAPKYFYVERMEKDPKVVAKPNPYPSLPSPDGSIHYNCSIWIDNTEPYKGLGVEKFQLIVGDIVFSEKDDYRHSGMIAYHCENQPFNETEVFKADLR